MLIPNSGADRRTTDFERYMVICLFGAPVVVREVGNASGHVRRVAAVELCRMVAARAEWTHP